MKEYLSVKQRATTLTVIEKSKFYALCAPVQSEEEAQEILQSVRKSMPDATHHCYGYIADTKGAIPRFSDDGEPGGTAGMPILKAITDNGHVATLVVVTRYFGGIKLGAGGLVRAYTASAVSAIEAAGKVLYRPCGRYLCELDYTLYNLFERAFSRFCYTLEQTDYGEGVTLTLLMPKEGEQAFNAYLKDFSKGRSELLLLEECYAPM